MDRHYKWIYWSIIGAAGSGLLVYLGGRGGLLAIAVMFLCMVLGFSFLLRVARVRREWATWAGIAFMVAAALFDVDSTLAYSPDLSRAANPVARILLGHGLSNRSVIALGSIYQIVFAISSCLIWSTFCSNFKEYSERVSDLVRDGSWAAMYGTTSKGFRALWGRTDPFLFVNGIAPVLLGVFLYRVYLALEWHGVVPVSRTITPVSILLASIVIQHFFVGRSAKMRGNARI